MKLPSNYKGMKHIKTWRYTDKDSTIIGLTGRYEDVNRKKEVIPFFRKQGDCFKPGIAKNCNRELYNLRDITSTETSLIIVTEGEKCADLFTQLGFCTTTSIGGSKNADASDFSMLAKFKAYIIWQDNDESGEAYKNDLYDFILFHNPEAVVKVICTGDKGSGHDAIDWAQKIIASWDGYSQLNGNEIKELHDQFKTLVSTTPDYAFPWTLPIKVVSSPPNLKESDIKNLGVISEYTLALSKSTETPIEFCFMNILAVISIVCQRIAKVQVKPDYHETLTLWVCNAMESGNRKSPVISKISEPLREIEKSMAQEVKKQRSEIEERNFAHTEAIKNSRNAITKIQKGKKNKFLSSDEIDIELNNIENEKEKLEDLPSLPQLTTSDSTPEGIVRLLKENSGYIGILSDEGGILDTINGRYNNNIPNLDVFLKGYSGDYVSVNRMHNDPISVDSANVAFGISPQPSVLLNIMSDTNLRNRGFIARFCLLLPESRVGYRISLTPSIPSELSHDYSYLLKKLMSINNQLILCLSTEAFKHWLKLSEETEREMRVSGKFFKIKDWASKYPGKVIRIAGILHLIKNANNPEKTTINIDTFIQAQKIGELVMDHVEYIYNDFLEDENNEFKHLITWLRKTSNRSFSFRECQHSLKSIFQKAESLEPVIQQAINAGLIRSIKVQKSISQAE